MKSKNFGKKLKQIKKIVIRGSVLLCILLAIGHLLVTFTDGEQLAWQVVPSLPDNLTKVSDVCLSGSSRRCRAINYITPESPESVIRTWSERNINTFPGSENSTIYYQHKTCNYNIIGINYAVLHVYPHQRVGLSCAIVGVQYDQEKELTNIRVYLTWTNCLRIVKIFVPYTSRHSRHCYNG